MRDKLGKLRLNVKVALLAAGSALVIATSLMAMAVRQSGHYQALAQREVDELLAADLNHIAEGVYNLVRTENETVQEELNDQLQAAIRIMARAGGVGVSGETADWTAVNQFTGRTVNLRLPRMTVGGRWLGQNDDPAAAIPGVDEITALTGAAATIFQRMNRRGDMLCAATTVTDSRGRRAIGTYIPAVMPDGAPNPVIAAVLRGETYRGRAYIVNQWYLAACRPLLSENGRVIGMLCVGVEQRKIEARVRRSILQTEVGKTGYVYVLGGKGAERGQYIISYKGARDGENVWNMKDAGGNYVIREIIRRATALRPGETAVMRYRWQNPGEPAARWKVTRLAYFSPWDWVIGTSAYEDELIGYRETLSLGRARMTRSMSLAGLIMTLLVGMAGIGIAWAVIVRPIRQMTRAAETIIRGNLDVIVPVQSHDEIGALARTFNYMSAQLKQTLEGLRASEEKYKNIYENALEGIFRTTLKGRFYDANSATARILGYGSPGELIASITDLRSQVYVRPSDRDKFLEALKAGRPVMNWELPMYAKGRREIWIAISARLTRGEGDNPPVIEGFITDITERKRAEAEREILIRQLEDKNRELEDYSYSVSHDLKSPLITIKGFLGRIRADAERGGIKEVGSDIDRVFRAVDKMKELLDGLLRLSRVGRVSAAPEAVPLADVVAEAVETVSGRIIERKTRIEIAPDLPVVYADRSGLQQVLVNLIENAVKFTRGQPEPKVSIGCECANGEAVCWVADNGVGIAPQYHERIFRLFEKLEAGGEGTGVGLAIVKRIVETQGGRIWVESEGEGKGSVFRFAIPCRTA